MSDRVSGLLAAIERLEKEAEALGAKPWYPHGFYVEEDDERDVARFGSKQEASFVAANGPQAVLRLCRAHRNIIEKYKSAERRPTYLMEDHAPGITVLKAEAVAKALREVVEELAEGYRIQEENSDECP